jgi:hypothetical protein
MKNPRQLQTTTAGKIGCHDIFRDRDGSFLLAFLGWLLGRFLLCHSDNLLSVFPARTRNVIGPRGPFIASTPRTDLAAPGDDRVTMSVAPIFEARTKIVNEKNAENLLSSQIFSARPHSIGPRPRLLTAPNPAPGTA